MPTEKPRVSFALSKELLKRIDDFKYENRIKNQSQAIIALINRGFEAVAGTQAELQALSKEETDMLNAYRDAMPIAKEIALKTLLDYPAQEKASRA